MGSGRSVFSVLAETSRADILGSLALGFGRSVTVWRNESDRVSYAEPTGYTFSLYLAGGEGTRRLDGRPVRGWPGAVCLMPHGRTSEWEITTPFTFVHVNLPPDEMGRAFAEISGRDARLLDLAEVTFAPEPLLAAPLRRAAAATFAEDCLAAEAAMTDLLGAAFTDPRHGDAPVPSIRGGLAPHLTRRIADHVEAHLDGPLRLEELARLVGLSAFHLQRSFRASHGVSPHVWLAHRRVARAKTLLRGRSPIAEVALACGFSSQSHLTRAFKLATGATPAAFRSCVVARSNASRRRHAE